MTKIKNSNFYFSIKRVVMTIKKIEESIAINASKQKVWQVLFEEKYIAIWYEAFGENISTKTDWQLGSIAVFTDSKGHGMIGKITSHIPNEQLVIEYTGLVLNGKEDFESDGAKAIKGSQETYILEPLDKGTMLSITCDMDDAYFEMMSDSWSKALEKIKHLSEAN